MAKYKAYPEYKDSDIEWLGKIPSGWLLKKAKYIFQRVQRPLRDIDGVVTAFRDGQVTLRTNRRTDGFTNSVKEIGYQGVRRNDLVIHAMDGFAGAIGVSDSDGKCSPVCSVCIPWQDQPLNMRFYGYLVRQLAVTDFILSLAKGIRERSTEFRFNEFSGLMLPIPPVYEQDQIAKFLDHETAKIDNLIEKQQQLIELLKEKRQAVISHAVTKGLNPGVPMKDSGVEWLGKVPAHWGVMPVKYVCALIKDGTHLPPPRVENGIPLLSVRNIIDGVFQFRDDDSQISHKDYKSLCSSFIPKKDDVLLAIVGATLGKVALVPEMDSFHIQRSLGVFRTNKLIHPQHLSYIFESKDFQNLLWENAGFSAQPGIYLGTLSNFCVPVPPVTEQLKISEFITATVDKLDLLITQASKLIGLIQERRTALISAAVTGKIDVRDWIAPEAQGVEESQEAIA
ncbi:restriction endonuclease subunit S [Enterobacter hormaechei]